MIVTGQRSILAGESCPISGLEGVHVGMRDGVALREGEGTLLAWAWESEEAYERMYTESSRYHDDRQRAEGMASFWERDTDRMSADAVRLESLTAIAGPLRGLRMCDVGAGTGMFASLACQMYGAGAVGIEPNAGMVAQGQTLGRPVALGSWRDVQATNWDVITLHDVFEHLTRPAEALEHLRSSLAPRGVLVIEMPEWRSPHQRRAGLGWKHIRPRQHVCLYSRLAAETLYERHGFDAIGFVRPLAGTLGKMTHYLVKQS